MERKEKDHEDPKSFVALTLEWDHLLKYSIGQDHMFGSFHLF